MKIFVYYFFIKYIYTSMFIHIYIYSYLNDIPRYINTLSLLALFFTQIMFHFAKYPVLQYIVTGWKCALGKSWALFASKIKIIWTLSVCDIKNNAWVTANNDFWVTSKMICQWLPRVTKLRVKSLANRVTSDPKIVIRGNGCINLFFTRHNMSWTHNSAKNNHRSLISQFSPRTIFSE